MRGVTPWSRLVCVSQRPTLKRYAAAVIVSDCGLSSQDAWGGLTVTAGMCLPKAYIEEGGYYRPVYPYGFAVIPTDSDPIFRCYAGWIKITVTV